MNNIEIKEDQYQLASLIRACRLQNDTVRICFPIQRGMLDILLHQVNEEFQCQPYLRSLYQTLFCITYYGLLRVSEVTTGHPILAKDVQVALNKKKILLVLRTSKTHGKNNFPQMIKISAANIKLPWEKKLINDNYNNYCPYQLIREFA